MPIEGLKLVKQGKVRDMYETSEGIIMVASDRISAYDVVLPTPIPYKGAVLAGLSAFWFDATTGIIANHLLATNPDDFPPEAKQHADFLRGRAMLVRAAEVVPIECVARGYLSGSGWKEYKASQSVCGIPLPKGLQESDRLPEPIFTPATKAEEGHDENISFERSAEIAGHDVMEALRDATLALYVFAAELALHKGIIIADTKFEFGIVDGEPIVIDEMLTPDSSRFWPAGEYRPGGAQPSFDKQFARDYCESLGWDKTDPGPELPDAVITGTRARYIEAFERLTEIDFDDYLAEPGVVLR
jgi:phosphoribosylaminoimidazole-succinocarboxamide synthase